MNSTRRSSGGFYILLLLCLLAGYFIFTGTLNHQGQEPGTDVEFRQAVEKQELKAVTIQQNTETPTGRVTYQLNDGTLKYICGGRMSVLPWRMSRKSGI